MRDRIAPCSSVASLQAAWENSKVDLKYMPATDRLALAAMKDFYKRLISEGGIKDYLAQRAVAATMYTK